MTRLLVDGEEVLLDKEGYLKALSQWTPEVASVMASAVDLELTQLHWEIIYEARFFYETYEMSPAMRPLCKYLSKRLGPDKSGSIYLMTLFPNSPAKMIARLAGLPRPDNCL